MRKLIFLVLIAVFLFACKDAQHTTNEDPTTDTAQIYQEQYRPQYHFSPESGWMNDPNGLVYHEGLYHLFYQYYPNATVWGPMHWGHAVSKDLVKWQHRPIALFPDEKGFIFSGSAVVDTHNTSGFSKDGKVPLIAIYTYFRMDIEKKGDINTQTQGIAYSLDNGDTWTKYEGNPIIDNTTLKDFRDPKVFWHDASKSWIMVLVAGDHAKFYRSADLKSWSHISDFGKEQGAHAGVWECPDLFKLKVDGTDEEKWVLIISIGSGGPNGGSGTQYFVGDFDGDNFTTAQTEHKWLDWGTDNYAGVTYNNTPNGERVFIGWMSNWQYALKTPTSTWRSAMTLPRSLFLKKQGESYVLTNYPVTAIDTMALYVPTPKTMDITANGTVTISDENINQSVIAFKALKKDFKLAFGNGKGENTAILFDAASNLLMLDRTESGETDFNYEFGNKLHYMAMNGLPNEFEVKIFLDRSSIELFINKGQFVMTAQLFPTEKYTDLSVENLSDATLQVKDFSIRALPDVW